MVRIYVRIPVGVHDKSGATAEATGVFASAGTICRLSDWLQSRGDLTMDDEIPTAPFVYEGLDPAPQRKSTIADVTDAAKGAAHRVSDAIESGKKPGMPLAILSNIAREAPLGSLLVAFLLGVAVARRR
jgi:hypothetical protein